MALSFFSPLTGKVLHFVFSCPSCVQLYELSQETVGESCSREEGGEFKSQILFLWKVSVNDSSVMLKSKGNRLQNQPTILTSDHFGLYFTFFLHYEKVRIGMLKYSFRPTGKHINYIQGVFFYWFYPKSCKYGTGSTQRRKNDRFSHKSSKYGAGPTQ